MRLFVSFATALCAIGISLPSAAAQPGDPGQPPPQPPTPTPAPTADTNPNIDQGVLDDANSGRTWMSPTALTPPKGTWTFSNHMLFLVGGSYSPTDTVAISASTLIPISNEQPFFGYFTGKAQLVRTGRVRFAGHASAVIITDDDSDDGFAVGTLGGALTYCLDPACHSILNVFAGGGFSSETDNSSVPIVVAGSLIQRLSKRVKLVLEADSALILGEINDVGEGVLAWYGARFTSRNIGVDFGLFKPLCADCDTEDVFPLGFPWLSFTYRGGL